MSTDRLPQLESLDCSWIPATAHDRDHARGEDVLVILHGRGDSADGFRWMPEAFELPTLNYLLVNAPDPYFTGYSWYDLPPHQAPGVARSRARLDALFEELGAHGLRPEQTVLFGFSQGCLMTLEWGARSPLPLAGYLGVSGYCLDPTALLAQRHADGRPERWLITHGRHDEVLPFETTRQQIRELQRGGFSLQFEAYDKGHTIDPHEELPRLRAFVARALGLS
jgi:phospholipase/carboxylesterase